MPGWSALKQAQWNNCLCFLLSSSFPLFFPFLELFQYSFPIRKSEFRKNEGFSIILSVLMTILEFHFQSVTFLTFKLNGSFAFPHSFLLLIMQDASFLDDRKELFRKADTIFTLSISSIKEPKRKGIRLLH